MRESVDADTITKWIRGGKKKSEKIFKTIETCRRYYQGDQWRPIDADYARYKDHVVDNIIAANVNTIIPTIIFRSPKAVVTARGKPRIMPDGSTYNPIAAQKAFELLLDYYIRELDLKGEAMKAAYDAELGPWGIIQIGYSLEAEQVETENGLNELIKSDSPYIIRRSPLDLLVDPAATDHMLRTARWIALKWTKTKDEMLESGKYKKKDVRELEPNYRVEIENSKAYKDDDAETLWERISGWTVWDKKSTKVYDMADGGDKILYEGRWPLQYEGFPIEPLYYYDNPDQVFPITPVAMDIPVQDELNRVSTLQLTHLHNAVGMKGLVNQNQIDSAQKDQLVHGPANIIVDVTGDPNTAISWVKAPNMSQDIMLMRRQLKEDNRQGRGISQFEQGVVRNLETAAEASAIEQGTSPRRAYRVMRMENFLERIIRKLAQTIQQTISEKELRLNQADFEGASNIQGLKNKMSRILDRDTETLIPWISLDKTDIEGEFDFTITAGSALPINEMAEKQDAVGIYNMTRQDPYFNPVPVRMNLMKAFNLDPGEMLKNPQEAEAAMQAQAQTQAEAPLAERKLKNEADLVKTEMKSDTQKEIATMKAQTEIGKAMMEKILGGGDANI